MIHSDNRNMRLRCIWINSDTEDVKTFRLVNTANAPFVFKAGQFVTLRFTIKGQDYQRCYTIASSPNEREYIDLTVKLVPDGVVSNWLLKYFKVGDCIDAVRPAGTFYLDKSHKNSLLMISAGSGVTPMLSMLRTISSDEAYTVKFHHSARSRDDLISHDELAAISSCNSGMGLQLSYNFSREYVEKLPAAEALSGRVTKQMLSDICGDLTVKDVFVCGPPEFMALVKESLLDLGLPDDQYFEESFEITPVDTVVDVTPEEYDLTFSHSEIHVKIASNQTVLEAAEDVGIYLDYSCSSGICGSCTSYLIEGNVYAPEANALDDSDIVNGEFLPCCSFARSNLVVDL